MISADSIRLSFRDREIIRDGVLHLEEGEVVGLLGRNGAGKSCLYRILLGELRANCASIFIDGNYTKKPFSVPGLISYLPQKQVHPRRLRISTLMKLYAAPERALLEQLPEFSGLLNKRFSSLSGGEARLLELYLILMMPTRFTLLDEPFAGLSPLATERASEMIVKAGGRKGIMVSDHHYETLLTITGRNYLFADLRLRPFRTRDELQSLGYLPSRPTN